MTHDPDPTPPPDPEPDLPNSPHKPAGPGELTAEIARLRNALQLIAHLVDEVGLLEQLIKITATAGLEG